ncbi:hypothetical protein Tco_1408053 [Tanacetum coccineum]
MKDMEKFIMERTDIEGRMKKKFKKQDRHFVGLGCDNIEIDRTVRKVMSNLFGVKKLVKGLSDRFDEYERSKVFKDKKILEKELVNERNRKDFYREFSEYMCRMLQKRQRSEDGLPVPSGSQVRKPPVEPFARSTPALRSDDPYVVARDAAAAVTTSDIDDDDDTASMDSQPYEPRDHHVTHSRVLISFLGVMVKLFVHDMDMSWYENSRDLSLCCDRTMPPKRSLRGDPPPPLIQETVNHFMKCSPITFRGNEGAVGLIRWIEKTKMVFTVSKCIEANKVVFAAATFQDRALSWWNSQVATSGMEAVTRKTWAEMKVMMTEEFCPPAEIQR